MDVNASHVVAKVMKDSQQGNGNELPRKVDAPQDEAQNQFR